ncbi:nuclear transport factor 2 family protein [Aliikangiella sp. G2MR2-5]|uniref:nuclear transport factor 2 family protein n=1 Tax=Aliikangiella sp. G2MR2-5 TaxID=2788943 RepID=UPI001AEF00A8|nr:nuclear transport factor 2 family protein [Aliikangiella sp. G2MR2-5]
MKKHLYWLTLMVFISFNAIASDDSDRAKIKKTARLYIESQIQVNSKLMESALDRRLAKRTYWTNKAGEEIILESDYEIMIKVADSYNKDGDRFPENPKIQIDILDTEQNVASVKLTVDDWVDYMHLYKNKAGEWKIINVLWQFHNTLKHSSAVSGS